MTAEGLDETLAVIAKRAKELREAGVVGRVIVGHIDFVLAEREAPSLVPIQPPTDPDRDPLDDEDTFGGEMPRRREPSKDQE